MFKPGDLVTSDGVLYFEVKYISGCYLLLDDFDYFVPMCWFKK